MDKERYARQIALPEMGEEGQLRLARGKVLVVGAGGLGSPVIMYLAAAGVGNIGIMDGDKVDITNLQRQIIHTTADLGVLKAESAAQTVKALNPEVDVKVYPYFGDCRNLPGLIEEYDFIIDATDSHDIKFLLNDLCVAAGKPLCHGAIYQYSGQLMTILPTTATYRDLFDEETQAQQRPIGPLGVVPGVIGTLQAAEAIKYLTGIGELLADRLLIYNALTSSFRTIRIR